MERGKSQQILLTDLMVTNITEMEVEKRREERQEGGAA